MSLISVALENIHNKEAFSCGNQQLDNYFKKQAKQDIKRKLSACFVISERTSNLIKGYYTLSNTSIPLSYVPESIKKKLPRSYESIPAILLGRLEIDMNFQGKGIGKVILIDALKRCWEISKTLGSFAVIVDPIDPSAELFYNKFGFILLPDSNKMFLPMKTIQQLFT